MKMRKQRLIGTALVLLSWLLLILAAGGGTTEDRDATAVLVLLPLGLYMIFAERYILYP